MALNTLHDLMIAELKDLYSAEKQLVSALPKMAKAAGNENLKQAITLHLEQTKGQVARLEEIFGMLDTSPRGKKCKAMEGLCEEGAEMLEEEGEDQVRDAGIIAAAQRVEHYEIAAYGSTIAFARQMGHDEIVTLLEQSLEEEKATDVLLSELAVNEVNVAANELSGDDEDMADEEDESEDAPAAATSSRSKAKSPVNAGTKRSASAKRK
ncbi:MAG: ferritin-like domain-containing protein [Gemmatimonadaceae bacterium]|nr:ferritin-like domain-containing protein [Gemmatimonadaceae bacterium]